MQKAGLAAFAPLFPAAGKNNYIVSVAHFLATLEKYLNEFLDTYTYNRKDRDINSHINPLWKLVHDLLEAFEMDNAVDHNLFKNNSPPQLNQEGLIKLNQVYKDGLRRIKEIYQQEVIKTDTILTKGRRALAVIKTKISDLPKIKKSTKKTIPEDNSEGSRPINQDKVLQTNQLNEQNSQLIKDDQEIIKNQHQLKHQRVITTEEEKAILNCLLQKKTIPTEDEINEVLSKLSQEWDV